MIREKNKGIRMSNYSALEPDGKILQLLDNTKSLNGFAVTKLFDYLTEVGKVFTVRKSISITAGSSNVELWFNINSYTKDRLILLPPSFSAINGGPIRVDIYFGAQKQNGTGTEIGGFNRNANFSSDSEARVMLTPTTTFAGIIGPQFLIKSTDVTNQSGGAGDSTYFDIPYIYNPTDGPLPSNARAVINHLGADDALMEYLFIWAEI